MRVNIVDTNKFVNINNLQEVTNPVYFDRGRTASDDGLFSYRIFGRPGSKERKQVFAYIDLKRPFLHPLVFKNLKRLNRKFEDVVAGNGTWTLVNGILVEDPNGDTGLDFLYDNWYDLKFKESGSMQQKERIDFIKGFKREEAFMSKQIVIPAYYRDIDFQNASSGKIAHDEINDKYAKLLRLVATIDTGESSGFDFVGNITKMSIQNVLIDIFDYFTSKIEKKNGIFRQAVMCKSTDFSCRSVISESNYNMNSYKDLKVTFEYSGVPLTQCLVCFFPFAMKWLQDFFDAEFNRNKYIEKFDPKQGKMIKIALAKDCMADFEYDKLEKKINQFVKAPEERFEVIKIKTELGYQPLRISGNFRDPDKGTNSSTISSRYMTWTDLFFMCAYDITQDKHVYITRYPIEDYFGIYPTRVRVLSTFKTAPQTINGVEYKFYPVIDLNTPKEKVPGLFIDALQLFNGMLAGIGGDFDGDQVTIRGCFTQEANAEAEKLIFSPNNILTIRGDNIRTLSNEAVQALYAMTK